jgi:hypothetical protein
MFDHYDDDYQGILPFAGPSGYGYEPERQTEDDRVDYALEGVSRFAGLFSLGITVTLIVRWVPPLLPFYWIAAIAAILTLTLPAYLSRSARLLAIAITIVIAIFTGWLDQITHTGEQLNQSVQEVLK